MDMIMTAIQWTRAITNTSYNESRVYNEHLSGRECVFVCGQTPPLVDP